MTAATNDFANIPFAGATKQTKPKKDKVMKTKRNILNKICAMQQSNWLKPAVMTLALVAAVLGVTGCNPHH